MCLRTRMFGQATVLACRTASNCSSTARSSPAAARTTSPPRSASPTACFTWVGDAADVAGEPAIDLGGRTVVPGFLDVHTHPAMMAGLVDAVRCLPPEVTSSLPCSKRCVPTRISAPATTRGSRASATTIRSSPRAAARPRTTWTGSAARSRSWSAAATGTPRSANHRALQLAGITADSADPAGGRYGRHPDGSLTGELIEMSATAQRRGRDARRRPTPTAPAISPGSTGTSPSAGSSPSPTCSRPRCPLRWRPSGRQSVSGCGRSARCTTPGRRSRRPARPT